MLKKLKSFVIDRKVWLRGGFRETGINSVLYDKPSGKMCCLGIYCSKSGISKDILEDKCSPADVSWHDRYGTNKSTGIPVPSWLIATSKKTVSDLADKLMEINDDSNMSEKEREIKVKGLFAKKGIKISFR